MLWRQDSCRCNIIDNVTKRVYPYVTLWKDQQKTPAEMFDSLKKKYTWHEKHMLAYCREFDNDNKIKIKRFKHQKGIRQRYKIHWWVYF